MAFASVIQDTCNCWLKIVNHWHKRDNDVMCTRKDIKPGLKLVQMEADIAMHTHNLLSRKNLNVRVSIVFFCKFLQNKGLSQNLGLFHLEIGLA